MPAYFIGFLRETQPSSDGRHWSSGGSLASKSDQLGAMMPRISGLHFTVGDRSKRRCKKVG